MRRALWQRLLKRSMQLAQRGIWEEAIQFAEAAVSTAVQQVGAAHPSLKEAKQYLVILNWSPDDPAQAVSLWRRDRARAAANKHHDNAMSKGDPP